MSYTDKRRRPRERGAVFVEALIVLLVIPLALGSIISLHTLFTSRAEAYQAARSQAWQNALYGCEAPPNAEAAAVDGVRADASGDPYAPLSEEEAARQPALDSVAEQQDADNGVAAAYRMDGAVVQVTRQFRCNEKVGAGELEFWNTNMLGTVFGDTMGLIGL